jgi:predicted molibdopterin-dependent oxidoreductase YjgC
VAGLAASFGSGAMTNSIGDLGMADVILVVGSNTTEAHPIIGIELKRAARLGKRNAMMRVILDEGLADESFIEKRTEGFDGLRTVLAEYAPEIVSEIIGVSAQEIRAAARAYASADAAAIVYCMGVTQHESGTAQVRSLANLAMLTGNMGRPGTGVNPLRGQNNVQGACDMACLPGNLPGYARVDDDADRARFEKAWGTKLSSKCGLTLTEAMDAAADGEVRAMYIMGENPVLSDPDQAHVIEALEKLDFLVVQDLFMTETAALADVVLPGAAFVEKDGTFTNTERRVQRVRAVVPSPGRMDTHRPPCRPATRWTVSIHSS